MLSWDVGNGLARRSWARNNGAIWAIKQAMQAEPLMKVTIPEIADEEVLNQSERRHTPPGVHLTPGDRLFKEAPQ